MKKVVVMGLWLAIAQGAVFADEIANVPPPPDLNSSAMAVDINTAAPSAAVEGYIDSAATAEVTPAVDTASSVEVTAPGEAAPVYAAAPVETAVVSEETTVASTPTVTAPVGDNVDTEQVGRVKVQTITNRDRYGTIQEERVNAMRSELHYIPEGSSEGYALVNAQNSQGKTRNAHDRNSDSVIPSWKLFSW
jgi:hypothetical protein